MVWRYDVTDEDRQTELIRLATNKRKTTYAENEQRRQILQALVREGLLAPKSKPINPLYQQVYALPPGERVQLTDAGRAYVLALNPDDFKSEYAWWYPLPDDVRAAQAALSR